MNINNQINNIQKVLNEEILYLKQNNLLCEISEKDFLNITNLTTLFAVADSISFKNINSAKVKEAKFYTFVECVPAIENNEIKLDRHGHIIYKCNNLAIYEGNNLRNGRHVLLDKKGDKISPQKDPFSEYWSLHSNIGEKNPIEIIPGLTKILGAKTNKSNNLNLIIYFVFKKSLRIG